MPAVRLSVGVTCLLAVPSLYSATAYGAVTAIKVIGITPAYAIAVYLRLRAGDRFEPGPWNLGGWSRPVGWTAVSWWRSSPYCSCCRSRRRSSSVR